MQQDSKEVWQCLAVFREAVSRYISQRDNQLQVMKRKRDLAKTVRLQQLEEMNSRDPTRRAVGKAETYIEVSALFACCHCLPVCILASFMLIVLLHAPC